jgi:crooked neck
MELKNKFINHAKNVLERSITILPREDQFWLRYIELEEELKEIEEAHQLYQRWIAWEPPVHAYISFVHFEMRQNRIDQTRSIFERLLLVHQISQSYL